MDSLTFDHMLNIIKNNIWIVLVFFIFWLLYRHYTSTHGHFEKIGVPFIQPVAVFGNTFERIVPKRSFHEFNIDIYNRFKEYSFGGIFEGRRPILIIRNPNHIKNVLIRDFEYFVDRNTISNSAPYLKNMIITLKGSTWKSLRASLTPAFSSGKLRAMEKLLLQCGDQMCEFLNNRNEGDLEIEMKSFIERYTLEVIGSCAFGLDCASLKDPNAKFIKVASKFGEVHIIKRIFLFLTLFLCPTLLRNLPVSFLNTKVLQELGNVATNIKNEREKDIEKRREDFLQLMIDISHKESDDNSSEKVMNDDVITAQAILFLIAGFETTSTMMAFCCSALCENVHIQDKLRKEIVKKSLENNEGKSMYDILNEIPLLEKVLLETLRMYPPVGRIDRTCTKPYTMEGTNIHINKGDVIAVSIAGILHDPEYYPNPEIFDPERFSSEEKLKRPNHLFLPFGAGPRNCIGLRFAMMSAKFGLFHLLKNFNLSPCSKTEIPLTYNKRNFLLKADKGHWMTVEPIKT